MMAACLGLIKMLYFIQAEGKLALINYNNLSDSSSHMANVKNINNCIRVMCIILYYNTYINNYVCYHRVIVNGTHRFFYVILIYGEFTVSVRIILLISATRPVSV